MPTLNPEESVRILPLFLLFISPTTMAKVQSERTERLDLSLPSCDSANRGSSTYWLSGNNKHRGAYKHELHSVLQYVAETIMVLVLVPCNGIKI